MATEIVFESLRKWPGEPRRQFASDQFQASYADTLTRLKDELRLVSASRAVVKAVFDGGRLRKDGLPMESAKMGYPGVIVVFMGRKGDVTLRTERYRDWRSNLRGIVLSMEALRGVNRWGCAEANQQYLGFPALPAPDPDLMETAEDAARFIARLIDPGKEEGLSALLLDSAASYTAMRKDLIRSLHPDHRNGEGGAEFVKFQEAEALMTEHYAEAARGGAG